MKKQEILERLIDMEGKYSDLVWLARKRPEDSLIAGVQSSIDHVEKSWPKECEELRGDESDWHHGFNSGCLAAFRFAMSLMGDADDVRMAEELFPFLDT
jgi:hypothetical protein